MKHLIIACLLLSHSVYAIELLNVRHSYSPQKTRVVLDFSEKPEVFRQVDEQMIEIFVNGVTTPYTSLPNIPQAASSQMAWSNNELTLLFEKAPGVNIKYFQLIEPHRLVLDFYSADYNENTHVEFFDDVISETDEMPEENVMIDTELDNIVLELDREQARQALATRIDELINAVLAQQISPPEARRLLITYREALSQALQGNIVDSATLRAALGLEQLVVQQEPMLDETYSVSVVDGEDKPYVAEADYVNEQEEKAEALALAEELDVELEEELTNETIEDFTEENDSEQSSVSLVTSELGYEIVNGIKRPILTNDLTIDFTDPLNPLELLFEAERQLLIADLEGSVN